MSLVCHGVFDRRGTMVLDSEEDMATKYAEWLDLECGKCRWLLDIGSITDKEMDPECEIHQQFKCVVCGDVTDGASKGHGVLGRVAIHMPVRP